MKIRIALALLLITAYGVYQIGFKGRGSLELYKINDGLSFAVRPREADPDSSITIQGTRKTSKLAGALCGECQVDYSHVDMPQAKFVRGDWVYSPYPQHQSATADILNLRTGEAINVQIPGSPTNLVNLSTLPAYRERGLLGAPEDKISVAYVKAHFPRLSTSNGTCAVVHLVFGALALFLIFPPILVALVDLIARAYVPQNDLGEGITRGMG